MVMEPEDAVPYPLPDKTTKEQLDNIETSAKHPRALPLLALTRARIMQLSFFA